MIALPIPLFTAAILGFLMLKAIKDGRTPLSVLALIFACASQSVIISLHHYYGLTWLRSIQPVTAMAIPALAFVAFISTSVRPLKLIPDGLHVVGLLSALAAVIWIPEGIDAIIVVAFTTYGAAILWLLRGGPDSLPQMRLGDDRRPLLLWRLVGTFLIASAGNDLLIFLAMNNGAAWLKPWVISLYSSGTLLLIGMLNLSDLLKFSPETQEEETGVRSPQCPREAQEDRQVIEALDDLMHDRQAFLDPDLTLRKISRQIAISEKQISASVNRVTGDNVPRYINAYRIEHASKLLREGQNITAVIYASGFNSKSNFNREFLRVKGKSPSEWRQESS